MEIKYKKISWVFQIFVAAIFLWVGFLKLSNNPTDVLIFTELEMEPFGRYLIGALEMLAGIFLLTHSLSATGAFLGLGIMFGAIIAHSTVLGANINHDEGRHIFLLVSVFISCLPILFIRKKQIPFIGNFF